MYQLFFGLISGLLWPILALLLNRASQSQVLVGQGEKPSMRFSLFSMLCLILALGLGVFYGRLGPGHWSYTHYRFLAAMVFLIPAAYWDRRTGSIPNFLIFTGLLSGIGLELMGQFLGLNCGHEDIASRLTFIGLLTGLLVLFRLLSKGGIGYGDIKLLALLGLFFEPLALFLCLVLSFSLAGLWSMGLLMTGRAKAGRGISFAPFLLAAYWICGFLWPKLVYR